MLKLKNVTKDYVSGELVVNALKGVDLKFRKSEFVAILGPSGCGKTTLLNIMGGLDQYTTGDLEINGISTVDYKDRDWDNYRNNSVGFVFQSYNLIMHQSVLANVELALTLSGVKKAERKERAKEALIKVGLEKEVHKMPNQLSGGQMQRVAIARAIVNNPHIILADEPTGALDTETSIQVMEILKEISKDRLVVMVTHNPELADKYASRIISMSDGLILNDTNPITAQEESLIEVKDDEIKEEIKNDLTCEQTDKKVKSKKQKKAKMSIWTAFSLSLKNLFTKKTRTILTSVAGSIGIIGIALILSVSSGFQNYINTVESSTLSSQAVSLRTQNLDYANTLTSLMMGSSGGEKEKRPTNQEIYPNPVTEDLVSKVSNVFSSTDLTGFNYYMQNNLDNSKIHGFRYNYGVEPIRFYGQNSIISDYDLEYVGSEDYKLLYPYNQERLNKANWPLSFSGIDAVSTITGLFNNFNPFSTPLLKYDNDGNLQDNWDLVAEQYDLIASYNGYNLSSGLKENQMVLVVDEYNQIPDSVLFSLGLRGEDALLYSMLSGFAENGGLDAMLDFVLEETFEKGAGILGLDEQKFNYFKGKYQDIKTRKGDLKWSQYFTGSAQGEADKSILVEACIYLFFGYNYNKARNERPITFNEIFALNARGNNKSGYKIIANADEFYEEGGIVKRYESYQVNDQLLNSKNSQVVTDIEIVGIIRLKNGATYGSLSSGLVYSNKLLEKLIARTDNNAFVKEVKEHSEDAFKDGGSMYNKYRETFGSKITNENVTTYTLNKNQVIGGLKAVTYKDLLDDKGSVVASNRRVVTEISLYASSFENKDYLINFINDFNTKVEDENSGVYGEKVEYSDLMGDLFKSVDIILNAITYVLVAFVGISLVVSSIMIGIIT
ncbi:MAG: ABC transporter ATP-binding protein, partial [Clostridia bacterium]|nr:ABC transporter ATP-binding protein [Clostridia bacterium]